jgi:hypothetical protein
MIFPLNFPKASRAMCAERVRLWAQEQSKPSIGNDKFWKSQFVKYDVIRGARILAAEWSVVVPANGHTAATFQHHYCGSHSAAI